MTYLNEYIEKLAQTGTVQEILGTEEEIGEMGPYPLGRTVSMVGTKAESKFKTGEVCLEFKGLKYGPIKVKKVTARMEKGIGKVCIELDEMEVTGEYAITAVNRPRVDIDTGGDMTMLVRDADGSITPQQYNWINQANDQRDQLKQSAGGQKAITTYNKYNDIYNRMYTNVTALQNYWVGDGATQGMAVDTSSAVKAMNTPINSPSATYGTGKTTYNHNSGLQSLYLMAACNAAEEYAAAGAIPTFQTQVIAVAGTQPDKSESIDNLNTMTADQVWKGVGKVKASDEMKFHAVNDQLLATVNSIGKAEHTDEHLDLIAQHFVELNEEHIKNIQEIHSEVVNLKKPENAVPLWSGSFTAKMTSADIMFDLQDHNQGVVGTTLTYHGMDLSNVEFGNDNWPGPAGELVKDRLNSAMFIYGLLTSKVSNLIEQKVAGHILETVTSDEG